MRETLCGRRGGFYDRGMSGKWRGWLRGMLLGSVLLGVLPGVASVCGKTPPVVDNTFHEPQGFRQIKTRYYILHTDLPEEQLALIIPHVDHMGAVYANRLAALSAQKSDWKLPFYLFARQEDYLAAGGMPGTVGVFQGERLLAITGEHTTQASWHVIQHEAFHHFLHASLGGDIRAWINEGMAEYYGESLDTGDALVSGLVPMERVQQIRRVIRENGYRPLGELLAMSQRQWNNPILEENYDQAWSMVHFLTHGDGGRHLAGMLKYLQESARGMNPESCFRKDVGDAADIEAAWREYWMSYPEEDSRLGYAEVAVQTVASLLARTTMAQQKITSFVDLCRQAKEGTLRQPAGDAIPVELFLEYLSWAKDLGTWEINTAPSAKSNVNLEMISGAKIAAKYKIVRGKGIEIYYNTQEAPAGAAKRNRSR